MLFHKKYEKKNQKQNITNTNDFLTTRAKLLPLNYFTEHTLLHEYEAGAI